MIKKADVKIRRKKKKEKIKNKNAKSIRLSFKVIDIII